MHLTKLSDTLYQTKKYLMRSSACNKDRHLSLCYLIDWTMTALRFSRVAVCCCQYQIFGDQRASALVFPAAIIRLAQRHHPRPCAVVVPVCRLCSYPLGVCHPRPATYQAHVISYTCLASFYLSTHIFGLSLLLFLMH